MTHYGKSLTDYILRWARGEKRSIAEQELQRVSQTLEQRRVSPLSVVGPSPDERRRTRRYEVKIELQMVAGGASSSAEIIDISQTGVKFISALSCRHGEIVRLHLPDTRGVNARVMWTNGDCYGAQFVGLGIQQTRQVSNFIASYVI